MAADMEQLIGQAGAPRPGGPGGSGKAGGPLVVDAAHGGFVRVEIRLAGLVIDLGRGECGGVERDVGEPYLFEPVERGELDLGLPKPVRALLLEIACRTPLPAGSPVADPPAWLLSMGRGASLPPA